jgi:hypothetical protein
MSVTNKLIETVSNKKLRDILEALVDQSSDPDGSHGLIRDSQGQQPSSKSLIDAIIGVNFSEAVNICNTSYRVCQIVGDTNRIVTISPEAYENFHYLSFFDMTAVQTE